MAAARAERLVPARALCYPYQSEGLGGGAVVRTLLTALAVLTLDLAAKELVVSRLALREAQTVIPGLLRLTHLRNPGAAFGWLGGQRWVFVAAAGLAAGLILLAARLPLARRGRAPWALGLMLGGAAGNLVDRLRHGTVVDFLAFSWRGWHLPVFNLADLAIVAGTALLILHLLRESRTT